MPQVFKTCLAFVLAIVLAVTGFHLPASASSTTVLPPSLNHLASLPSSETVLKAGKIALRVTPKVADKLVKKYGRKIVKIIPGLGNALVVIEISVDLYNVIQEELGKETSDSVS